MVHPHLRGAYAALPRQQLIFPGSSPHTWGIRFAVSGEDDRLTVHPHTRGAYTGSSRNVNSKIGSSPHTWGILLRKTMFRVYIRFIPTYVGHTGLSEEDKRSDSVYPHIRGAYAGLSAVKLPFDGSSPHTWGIRKSGIFHGRWLRFIPTYVGHTA